MYGSYCSSVSFLIFGVDYLFELAILVGVGIVSVASGYLAITKPFPSMFGLTADVPL